MAKSTHIVGSSKLDPGSAAGPSSTYKDDPNTGWFNDGADKLAAVTNGTSRLTIEDGKIVLKVKTEIEDGALGDLSLRFENDPNTGIYSSAPDKLGLVAGGAEILQVHAGGVIVNGTISSAFSGPGSLPIGSIVPIAANLAGAMSIPASGTLDGNGFQYCDGVGIAAGATMTGTIYNLTNSRFLQGSTAAGTTGGSNSISLTEANLGSHDHGLNGHVHSMAGHTHSMSHGHADTFAPFNTSSLSHIHAASTMYAQIGNHSPDQWHYNTVASPNWTSDWVQNAGGSKSQPDGTNPQTFGIEVDGNTGGPSTGSSASITGSVTSLSGNTGGNQTTNTLGNSGNTANAGSGTAFNNRPSYLNVVYVMRVK